MNEEDKDQRIVILQEHVHDIRINQLLIVIVLALLVVGLIVVARG